MLVCRACNTRYGDGMRVCPSCGRKSSSNLSEAAAGDSGPLPPSVSKPEERSASKPEERSASKPEESEIDLELDEEAVVDATGPIIPPPREKPAAGAARATPSAASDGDSGRGSSGGSSGSGSPGRSGSSGGRDPGASGSASPRKPAAPAPVSKPARTPISPPGRPGTDADQVKTLLAEQPGLLEKGLGLYADEEGEPLGIDFPTPVGSIDLLCRDRKGGFVVVHRPARDEVDESVSAMLRRMGWVRKHLANGGDDVRGVVVLDQLPEGLAYAAAGAAGSIAFKGYQLALTFHDLDA
jgi:hypothetical protein